MSQKDEILRHMQSGKRISPLQALYLFKCFRLGGRIYELRKEGYNIETDMVTNWQKKRYAEYYLVKS